MNKPFKDQMRAQFDDWYASQITSQLEGSDSSAELEIVELSFPAMKVRGARWLVAAAEHLANNPHYHCE